MIARVLKPRCGLWSCPYCGQVNKEFWTARVYHATEVRISEGRAISFTTLTTHERLTAAQALSLFPKQWPRLRKRAARRSPEADYVLIPEQHDSGIPHWHMLDTFNLPSRFWKDAARACGMGYMAESEFAETPGGAARYAAKYLGKGLQAAWPPHFRRVRTSQGFPPLPLLPGDEGYEWRALADSAVMEFEVWALQRDGYDVTYGNQTEQEE